MVMTSVGPRASGGIFVLSYSEASPFFLSVQSTPGFGHEGH